jgi:hypothetical protein
MTVFIFMFVVLVAMLGTSRAGGQLDLTFGNRGIVLSDSASSAGAVLVLPDGRILVGGVAFPRVQRRLSIRTFTEPFRMF